MLFNSPLFLFIFLPLIFAIFLAAPRRWRNIALLVGSCGFYAWGEPRFIFVVLLSAVFDWLLGRQLAVTAGTARGRLLLGLGVLANAAVLVYYKYFNFLLENLNGLLSQFGAAPLGVAGVLLPIGVSFIVFEKITYLVDIYRKTGEPSESLFDYLTYVFLFPKLLAGPIVKYHEIAGQLKRHEVSWDNAYAGVSRFGLGLAKKVFIADTASEVADMIFQLPAAELGFGNAWLGLLCFTLQIYFDFSAYSDMAIGLARIFGFTLRENFNMPYISQNFTEFWTRWHISLSSWIKEYIYIPLGGSRCSERRRYLNLWLSFLLSGIWHGANWTFVLWGVYHGLFIVLDKLFWLKLQQRLPRLLNVAVTFFFVMLGWAIFRSADLGQAGSYLQLLLQPFASSWAVIYLTANQTFFIGLGLLLVFLPLSPLLQPARAWSAGSRWAGALQAVLLLAGVLISIGKIATTTFQPFLYFRF